MPISRGQKAPSLGPWHVGPWDVPCRPSWTRWNLTHILQGQLQSTAQNPAKVADLGPHGAADILLLREEDVNKVMEPARTGEAQPCCASPLLQGSFFQRGGRGLPALPFPAAGGIGRTGGKRVLWQCGVGLKPAPQSSAPRLFTCRTCLLFSFPELLQERRKKRRC